jgi:hypothetical protein
MKKPASQGATRASDRPAGEAGDQGRKTTFTLPSTAPSLM